MQNILIHCAEKSWLVPIKRRGLYKQQAPLRSLTWFGTGGNAQLLYIPADLKDLAEFLIDIPQEVPLYILGAGSNTLARDGGVAGIILRLGQAFDCITLEPENHCIRAGAASLDRHVSQFAAEHGISGLEFLYTIPGTIGGALAMNAGSYGRDMSQVVLAAKAINRKNGTIKTFSRDDLQYSYRHCGLTKEWIFLEAVLQGEPDNTAAIREKMQEMQGKRLATQPTGVKTGGSTFLNPPHPTQGGERAWELLAAAGLRGYRRGGAMFSEQHCNFIINDSKASSQDIEFLIAEAKNRVKKLFNVDLHEEIVIIGEK